MQDLQCKSYKAPAVPKLLCQLFEKNGECFLEGMLPPHSKIPRNAYCKQPCKPLMLLLDTDWNLGCARVIIIMIKAFLYTESVLQEKRVYLPSTNIESPKEGKYE